MITEIKDATDAEQRLKTFFGDIKYFDQYVQMLALLVDEKRFAAGLEKVSALIWEAYNSEAIRSAPNRFTRSILDVANKRFGFACQTNVVLTAAAGSKAFGDRIRNGVLWKDSFALGHGEFAHSYQWLVAGVELGWNVKTGEIYKNTAGKQSLVPLFVKDSFAIALRNTQLWEYVVDSTRYDQGFEGQVQKAAKAWVDAQIIKWWKKETVNRSFENLFFRGTDPQIGGSLQLGEEYSAFLQKRSNDTSRNQAELKKFIKKKIGDTDEFVASLASQFPTRNALTENTFRSANNVTDLARKPHHPVWFITTYEDHRYARLYEQSNKKIRQLASQLLAAAKLQDDPLYSNETWQEIEALLYEINFELWDAKSASFYKELQSKVLDEAGKLKVPSKTSKTWFLEKLKGIPALKRERQEHYFGSSKKSQGWAPAQDDAGIFVRKIVEGDRQWGKNVIPAKFHGQEGTINTNALPGQLTV